MGIFIVLILTDLFIWWRMLSDLKHRSKVALAAVIVVKSLLTITLLVVIISMLLYKGEFAEPSNAFRYIAFGAIAALTITLGISYILISIGTLLLRRMFHRRLRGVIWTNMAIAGLLIILFTDGYFRQRFDLRIVREEIKIAGLDPRLEGLKIVLISDLHLSSFYGHYDKLACIIDSVNDLNPDLLINAGDFITYGWQEFGGCDTILNKAVAAAGSFAVAGNHDDGTYYPDYDNDYGIECEKMVAAKIRSSGYTLISDTSCMVTYNNAPLTIAGVTTHGHHLDMRYGDISSALALSDSTAMTIFVVHDPAVWDSMQSLSEVPDLTFTGHTHGMQLGLPTPWGTISPTSSIHKYWKGLYEREGRSLYVSTGIGTMSMAERIFMPPEIILLTLNAK